MARISWARNLSMGKCGRCGKFPHLDNLTLCEGCRKSERKRLLEYKIRHKDRLAKENKQYRENNKEKERLRIKDWMKRNPEKVAASRKRRHYVRDMLDKSAPGTFTAQDWIGILSRYGNMCLWCEKKGKNLTIDHVVPLSRGGTNNPNNLQPLCVSCNSKKKARILDFRPFGNSIMEWT